MEMRTSENAKENGSSLTNFFPEISKIESNLNDELTNHKEKIEYKENTPSFIDLSDISLVDSSYNCSGNYKNYVSNTIESIILIKIKMNIFQNHKFIRENINQQKKEVVNRKISKQILLLDLDETLIHSDFNREFNNYDAIIKFNEPKGDNNESDNINFSEEISVGIFIRNGLFEFLENLYEKFDIYIFTASTKTYADAVIDYIDPNKKYFKKRLYRNDCININNQIFIKDLSIFNDDQLNINSSNLIIVDNNLYSFMNDISNGVLISSFYNDKNDFELFNVLRYLIEFIYNADDVKEVNEKMFYFKGIMEELESSFFGTFFINNI